MLEFRINISEHFKDQFLQPFDLIGDNGYYQINPASQSTGEMRYVNFPGGMEFYHFVKTLDYPMHAIATNPENTAWYCLHVNLGKKKQHKHVANELLQFHKHLPMGVLLYGPDLRIETSIAANVQQELATIRFNKSFLVNYYGSDPQYSIQQSIIYSDLDHKMENVLLRAIENITDLPLCHSLLLSFVHQFFRKRTQRGKDQTQEKIHPNDLNGLFKAAQELRDPLKKEEPELSELARLSGMGMTKFKVLFRQVFGQTTERIPQVYQNGVCQKPTTFWNKSLTDQ